VSSLYDFQFAQLIIPYPDPYDNQVGEMELDGRGLRYEEFRRRKEVLWAEEIPQVIRP